jgi:hypothetical protein
MRHRSALGLVLLAACARTTPPVATPQPASVSLITADELRPDLTVFASDSFAGRETGTPAAKRAAQFIATRLMQLGLEPGGDSLYYQRVPLVREGISNTTQLAVTQNGVSTPLALGTAVVPWTNLGPGAPSPRRAAEGDIVFAGYGMNTLGRNDFRGIGDAGKVIVMVHEAPPEIKDSTTRKNLESQDELAQRLLRALQLRPAAIVLLMNGGTRDFFSMLAPELMRAVSAAPGDQTTSDAQRPLPMILVGLASPGSPFLPAGWPNDNAPQALTGRHFVGRVDVKKEPFTAYNVVGIVRGSDARMNKSYVALGAHYDHIGIQTGMTPDSIANGADDDGSGSMTMLAVARVLQASRPRRSAIFVWHIGEEKGLLGSAYFTDHPTVPIDSIVAQLNADMIGRNGGPTASFDTRVSGAAMVNKLFVVGPNAAPNNQSKVLGAILDSVNAHQARPMELDHEWDSTTHPEKIYERSDHYNYAKKGIPIIFFTTGLHEDYHKVSDESQKIDYDKMARIGNLLVAMAETVANREARPR